MFNSIKFQNDMFECMLKSAFTEYIENEIAGEPSNEELLKDYPVPVKGLKKMKRIIKNKKYRHPIYIVYLQRVAVIVLATITLISAVLMSSTRIRAAVKDTIIEWFDKYVVIKLEQLGKEEQQPEPKELSAFTVGYIPEEYVLLQQTDEKDFRNFIYVDDIGNSILINIVLASAADNYVDIEYSQMEKTDIGGYTAYIFTENDSGVYTTVVFGDSYFSVIISGTINREESIKIAENIKPTSMDSDF